MNYPSISMLPMNEIVTELQKVFLDIEDTATNTNAIGILSQEQVAKCTNITYEGLPEITKQDTVKNALYLNGIPASNYITIEQQDTTEIERMKSIFQSEILEVKSELYDAIKMLIKSGVYKEAAFYSCFQDYFENENIKYFSSNTGGIQEFGTHSSMRTDTQINRIVPSINNVISPGQVFVTKIVNQNNEIKEYSQKIFIATAVEQLQGLDSISFAEVETGQAASIAALATGESLKIGLVRGFYKDKNFVFATLSKMLNANSEKNTALLDYYTGTFIDITADNTGYATDFAIKEEFVNFNEQGALKSLTLACRRTGAPGDLTCYVIDKVDIDSITSVEALRTTYADIVLAKSKAINYKQIEPNTTQFVTFEFMNETNTQVVIRPDREYIFLITANTASANDKWSFKVGRGMSGDLHTNRTLYNFNNEFLSVSQEKGDLICYITGSDIAIDQIASVQNGLYTSKEFIATKPNIKKVRATLISTKENDIVTANTSSISVTPSTAISVNSSLSSTGLKAGDTVIINNKDIATIKEVTTGSSTYIKLTDNYFLEAASHLYKSNIKPFVKFKCKVGSTYNYFIVPMTLVSVKKNTKVGETDTLVFDCSVPNYVGLESMQLQIAWLSDLKEVIGTMSDLSLTYVEGV